MHAITNSDECCEEADCSRDGEATLNRVARGDLLETMVFRVGFEGWDRASPIQGGKTIWKRGGAHSKTFE